MNTEESFAAFAASCGLTQYPHPSGERYVYRVGGGCAGKKSEEVDLIDELWNALARSCGRSELQLTGINRAED